MQSRWLPLVLAVSVIFMPYLNFVLKLMGVLLALVFLYQSVVLEKNLSNRNILK
jgi:hypothetical protein